jgi:hypothetical protein
MNGKTRWTLKEIREAYRQSLEAYNELFPPHPETKKTPGSITEDMGENFPKDEEHFNKTLMKRLKKIFPKVKEAADHSGNAFVWHRGDPLDGLNQVMRERIEKALNFGI